MSKEQKRYLNWISRDLFNALEAIKRASNTYLEMNAKKRSKEMTALIIGEKWQERRAK